MNIEQRIASAVKDFENLTEQDCVEIVLASKSLTLEECYSMLLIDPAKLSPAEVSFATMLHKRGRAIGIKDATDKLFFHMSTRNGGQSAIDYLKHMSGEYQIEVTQGGNSGFSFKVYTGQAKS